MKTKAENFEERLAGLKGQIAWYADELGKLKSDADVTWRAVAYFHDLFREAVNLGMTEDEVREVFVPLNTTFTQVVDTNPNRGYRKWSLAQQKHIWVRCDDLSLQLMSPLQYQHWVFDVGATVGIKNTPAKPPRARPSPTPSAETNMTITSSVCPRTGTRVTVYSPRDRVA